MDSEGQQRCAVISGTPFDTHLVAGCEVHVKREDLCSPYPGPQFAKVRGLDVYLKKQMECLDPMNRPVIGVLDSFHSKAGWGTAWLCKQLGLRCEVFYPHYEHEPLNYVRLNQSMAEG